MNPICDIKGHLTLSLWTVLLCLGISVNEACVFLTILSKYVFLFNSRNYMLTWNHIK